MSRIRIAAGVFAGALLVASSVAHSFLGWKQLSSEIAKTNAPKDLVSGLAIGWEFGGLTMLVFGVIVMAEFMALYQRGTGLLRSSFMIGLAYVLFGAVAMVLTGGNPFFIVFIVPGVLLVGAAWPSRRSEA